MLSPESSIVFIILIAAVIIIVRFALERQRDRDRLDGVVDTPSSYTMYGMLKLIRANRRAKKQLAKAIARGELVVMEDKTEDEISAGRIGVKKFCASTESPVTEQENAHKQPQ